MATPAPKPERRRAARALADFPIQLSPKEGTRPGRLKDISEIGLACVIGQKLPEMTMVAIDFALPGQVQKHQVKGAVVRCEKLPPAGDYDVAVYFTEISAATRAALRGYVAKAKPAP